jgi:hypothetical protein
MNSSNMLPSKLPNNGRTFSKTRWRMVAGDDGPGTIRVGRPVGAVEEPPKPPEVTQLTILRTTPNELCSMIHKEARRPGARRVLRPFLTVLMAAHAVDRRVDGKLIRAGVFSMD